ncbi:MAG: twin-arginine translocation signal domain-containing protein [Planctomycetales bacterium]
MPISRRGFLEGAAGLATGVALGGLSLAVRGGPATPQKKTAQIAITLDLEMSAQYPRRDLTEWNFEKGILDEATKEYAVKTARLVKDRGG